MMHLKAWKHCSCRYLSFYRVNAQHRATQLTIAQGFLSLPHRAARATLGLATGISEYHLRSSTSKIRYLC